MTINKLNKNEAKIARIECSAIIHRELEKIQKDKVNYNRGEPTIIRSKEKVKENNLIVTKADKSHS